MNTPPENPQGWHEYLERYSCGTQNGKLSDRLSRSRRAKPFQHLVSWLTTHCHLWVLLCNCHANGLDTTPKHSRACHTVPRHSQLHDDPLVLFRHEILQLDYPYMQCCYCNWPTLEIEFLRSGMGWVQLKKAGHAA